jgi:hypothetical protein
MSMFIRNVSAFQQLQNWRSSQANINNNVQGGTGATSSTDYSAAFGNAASNYYVNNATLAAQEALTRVQQEAYAKSHPANASGPSVVDQRIADARAAGNEVLASFGYGGSFVSNSTTGSTTPSSAAPYTAPTNAATGYGYVTTSAASLSTAGALNMFA